jgi:hypothetical protein
MRKNALKNAKKYDKIFCADGKINAVVSDLKEFWKCIPVGIAPNPNNFLCCWGLVKLQDVYPKCA